MSCRCNNALREEVLHGTDFKVIVHLDAIGELHMRDYDFSCEFFAYRNKSLVIRKADMIEIDEDNYKAMITKEDAVILGRGDITCIIRPELPDEDFADGIRSDGVKICTNITII